MGLPPPMPEAERREWEERCNCTGPDMKALDAEIDQLYAEIAKKRQQYAHLFHAPTNSTLRHRRRKRASS